VTLVNNVEVRSALKGTTVTIRAEPDSGHTVSEMEVRDMALLHWVAETRVTDTTWTFVMPDHNVIVRPTFDTFEIALAKSIVKLETSTSRSWSDIAFANATLKTLQSTGWVQTSPSNLLTRLVTMVENKMKTEDMTKWSTGTFSSHFIAEEHGITFTYFVMSQNSGTYPTITPPEGWVEAPNQPTEVGLFQGRNYNYGEPRIHQIEYIYSVGYPAYTIKYLLWLHPVAQYTIEWDTARPRSFVVENRFTAGNVGIPERATIIPGLHTRVIADVGDLIYTRIAISELHPTDPPTRQVYTIFDQAGNVINAASKTDPDKADTNIPLRNFEEAIFKPPTSQIYRLLISNVTTPSDPWSPNSWSDWPP
jgi:hypothetical protein